MKIVQLDKSRIKHVRIIAIEIILASELLGDVSRDQ